MNVDKDLDFEVFQARIRAQRLQDDLDKQAELDWRKRLLGPGKGERLSSPRGKNNGSKNTRKVVR